MMFMDIEAIWVETGTFNMYSFIYASEFLTLASDFFRANNFCSRNALYGFIDTDTSSYNTDW